MGGGEGRTKNGGGRGEDEKEGGRRRGEKGTKLEEEKEGEEERQRTIGRFCVAGNAFKDLRALGYQVTIFEFQYRLQRRWL